MGAKRRKHLTPSAIRNSFSRIEIYDVIVFPIRKKTFFVLSCNPDAHIQRAVFHIRINRTRDTPHAQTALRRSLQEKKKHFAHTTARTEGILPFLRKLRAPSQYSAVLPLYYSRALNLHPYYVLNTKTLVKPFNIISFLA